MQSEKGINDLITVILVIIKCCESENEMVLLIGLLPI